MRRRLSLLFLVCLGFGLFGANAAGAELTGIVRDNRGHGLSNLTVKANYYDLLNGSTQTVTTTDAAGYFSFSGNTNPVAWNIDVPAAELNARGYLSVSSQYLNVTGDATVRFTTRKLDFTHRIAGHLADEAGLPLAGYSLRARITENNALFETNVVTGADGWFLLAATPAVWTFHGLEPPAAATTAQVFGEGLVEVEVTNTEKQVTFTAPTATSTISLTTTNLGGWDVVVQTEALGASYRLVKPVPFWSEAPLAIPVFNGVWHVSVTNSQPYIIYPQRTPAPAPLIVALTNETVSVTLTNTIAPSPNQLLQRVRTVTASGAVVSNASVFAISDPAFVSAFPTPPDPFGGPGVFDLGLSAGSWTICASTRNFPEWIGWDVTRRFDIATNLPLPEITLVFPEPGAGPRLFGTLGVSGGAPAGSRYVYLRMTDGGTNYSIPLFTDALGRFGTNVPPGRWQLETYATCRISSIVVVSNQDVEVNLEFSVPANGIPIPVNLSAVDETGAPVTDAWLFLSSGLDYSFPNKPFSSSLDLRPGIWRASLSPVLISGATPSYVVHPSLTWQLSPGVTATNLVMVSRRTPARIEGRLRNEQGRLLLSGYATAWTSVGGTNFWSYGAIDSGYFSLGVFPGEWLVGAAASGYPSVGDFFSGGEPLVPGVRARAGSAPIQYTTIPAPRYIAVTGDIARCEFTVTNIPELVTLTVTVLSEDGSSMQGRSIIASGPVNYQASSADSNGMVTFLTPPGRYWISAYPGFDDFNFDPLFWPSLRSDFQAPSNHILLVVRQPVGCIPGTISNAPTLGLQPPVGAFTDLNGTNYSIGVCPDTSGNFCVPAFPGSWTVEPDLGTLFGYGIQTVAPREVTVPPIGTPPRADFTLTPISGDFRTARFSPPVLQSDGRLRLELEGQAPLTWRVERSENLRDWTLVAIQSTAYRTLLIDEPPAPSRRAAFYRAVWVR